LSCQQQITYVPIKEDIELNVGLDDEVVWEMKTMGVERSNFTFDHTPPRVVGWDEARSIKEEIRNYRPKPIRVEVRHVLRGDVELEAEGAKLHDYQTVEFVSSRGRPRLSTAYVWSSAQGAARNAHSSRARLSRCTISS